MIAECFKQAGANLMPQSLLTLHHNLWSTTYKQINVHVNRTMLKDRYEVNISVLKINNILCTEFISVNSNLVWYCFFHFTHCHNKAAWNNIIKKKKNSIKIRTDGIDAKSVAICIQDQIIPTDLLLVKICELFTLGSNVTNYSKLLSLSVMSILIQIQICFWYLVLTISLCITKKADQVQASLYKNLTILRLILRFNSFVNRQRNIKSRIVSIVMDLFHILKYVVFDKD